MTAILVLTSTPPSLRPVPCKSVVKGSWFARRADAIGCQGEELARAWVEGVVKGVPEQIKGEDEYGYYADGEQQQVGVGA